MEYPDLIKEMESLRVYIKKKREIYFSPIKSPYINKMSIKTPQKHSNTKRLRTDLERPVGVATATQLVG